MSSKKKNKRLPLVIMIIVGVSAAWALVYLVVNPDENGPASDPASSTQTDARLYSETPGLTDQADIYLYFSNANSGFLSAEKRDLRRPDNPADLGKTIIRELIDGPRTRLVRTVPKQTVLNAFYVSDNGIAFVDFSQDIKDRHPGGSQSEYLTIYSIVNSIVYNIPEIKAVKMLINGNEAKTLAGHIGLQSPIRADMVMVR